MSYSQSVEALVFSRRSVGEADRLMTFFTQEFGLIKVLAKGVRKIPSRRGGHLEPLTIIKASLAGKDGRWYLTAVETSNYLLALRSGGETQAAAQFLAKIAVGFFEYEVAYPAVFLAMRRAWLQLPVLDNDKRWLLEAAVVVLLLREAGVMMRLNACRACGEREPRGRLYLDPESAGWVCASCSPGSKLTLEASDLKCLRYMSQGPAGALRLVGGAGQVSARLGRAVRQYARRSAFAVN